MAFSEYTLETRRLTCVCGTWWEKISRRAFIKWRQLQTGAKWINGSAMPSNVLKDSEKASTVSTAHFAQPYVINTERIIYGPVRPGRAEKACRKAFARSNRTAKIDRPLRLPNAWSATLSRLRYRSSRSIYQNNNC
jgi:hypothetical protein